MIQNYIKVCAYAKGKIIRQSFFIVSSRVPEEIAREQACRLQEDWIHEGLRPVLSSYLQLPGIATIGRWPAKDLLPEGAAVMEAAE